MSHLRVSKRRFHPETSNGNAAIFGNVDKFPSGLKKKFQI